jgi:hypothetical protein
MSPKRYYHFVDDEMGARQYSNPGWARTGQGSGVFRECPLLS